jgi:hypothetical protein
MNRRTVLSRLAAGGTGTVTGCASRGLRGGPPEDATASVEVTSVDAFAPDLPVEASVAVVRQWVTPEATASIEISLSNRSPRTYELLAGSGEWQVLSDRASDQLRPGVALLGEDATLDSGSSPTPEGSDGGGANDTRAGTPPPDGCWRLSDATGNPFRVTKLTRLDPGGAESLQFEAWGHYRNPADVCLPTGEFTFSDGYAVTNLPESPEFEWGFSLRIEGVA